MYLPDYHECLIRNLASGQHTVGIFIDITTLFLSRQTDCRSPADRATGDWSGPLLALYCDGDAFGAEQIPVSLVEQSCEQRNALGVIIFPSVLYNLDGFATGSLGT